jgi:hypothetical protein
MDPEPLPHQLVAQFVQNAIGYSFSQKVRNLIFRADWLDRNMSFLHLLHNKVLLNIDVLRTLVQCLLLGDLEATLVILVYHSTSVLNR